MAENNEDKNTSPKLIYFRSDRMKVYCPDARPEENYEISNSGPFSLNNAFGKNVFKDVHLELKNLQTYWINLEDVNYFEEEPPYDNTTGTGEFSLFMRIFQILSGVRLQYVFPPLVPNLIKFPALIVAVSVDEHATIVDNFCNHIRNKNKKKRSRQKTESTEKQTQDHFVAIVKSRIIENDEVKSYYILMDSMQKDHLHVGPDGGGFIVRFPVDNKIPLMERLSSWYKEVHQIAAFPLHYEMHQHLAGLDFDSGPLLEKAVNAGHFTEISVMQVDKIKIVE